MLGMLHYIPALFRFFFLYLRRINERERQHMNLTSIGTEENTYIV